MKKSQRNERFLLVAAGVLLLSIVLLIIVIPGFLNDAHSNAFSESATIALYLAIVFHLIIFLGYIISIRENRRSSNNRKGGYIGIAVLLILFGLFVMDGALAILPYKNVRFITVLMLLSAFFDFVASILTTILFFLKPQKVN